MRVAISSIQQYIKNKRIQNIFHVCSEDQIADVFTKDRVKPDRMLEVLRNSSLRKKQNQKSQTLSPKEKKIW